MRTRSPEISSVREDCSDLENLELTISSGNFVEA